MPAVRTEVVAPAKTVEHVLLVVAEPVEIVVALVVALLVVFAFGLALLAAVFDGGEH